MKWTVGLLLLLVMVVLSPGQINWFKTKSSSVGASQTPGLDVATLLGLVQQSGELLVLKLPVSDVISREVNGLVGGVRAVMSLHGGLDMSVDVEQAYLEQVNTKERSAVMVLPSPIMSRGWVDHDRSRLESLGRGGLWVMTSTDRPSRKLMQLLYGDAQRLIERLADEPVVIERARQHGAELIQRLAKMQGWSVSVRYQ